MNLKEIRELVDLITEKAITEFELERAGVRLKIRRGAAAVPQVSLQAVAAAPLAAPLIAPAPVPPQIAPPAPAPEPQEKLHLVKSPIVGTFYEAPSPGAPPFVKIGDRVRPGQVLCIIEAMKLMNEIESDVEGDIVQRLVENAQPVEYGELMFSIRPVKGAA